MGPEQCIQPQKSQEPRAKSQDPRTKNQEPRAKNEEPRAKRSYEHTRKYALLAQFELYTKSKQKAKAMDLKNPAFHRLPRGMVLGVFCRCRDIETHTFYKSEHAPPDFLGVTFLAHLKFSITF